ncbi:MAG: hypothetical protein ACI814_004619 [Mariniblastus sp.]|jgi:hypothetical protein
MGGRKGPGKAKWELYDLSKDLSEKTNLAKSKPEPHPSYQLGAGKLTGKDPAKAVVPPIFPDNDIVRDDILD